MLSKNQIKRIQSLARKKGRREEGCFIAEGNKLVEDTLSAFECDLLLATPSWIVSHAHESLPKIQEVDEQEMSKVSQLVTPPDVLAVYRIPEYHLNIDTLKKELVLALDTVQDPGNLGTIVRLADWFGIRHIVCSPDTADLYNPKVVQATMGALARVNVYYTSLPDFLSQVGFVGRVWYISRWGGYLSYLFDEIGGNCDGERGKWYIGQVGTLYWETAVYS